MGNKNGLCQHLSPREIYSGEKNGPWIEGQIPLHACRLKEAMHLEDISCPFSEPTSSYFYSYVKYNSKEAARCTTFTLDERLAEIKRREEFRLHASPSEAAQAHASG